MSEKTRKTIIRAVAGFLAFLMVAGCASVIFTLF